MSPSRKTRGSQYTFALPVITIPSKNRFVGRAEGFSQRTSRLDGFYRSPHTPDCDEGGTFAAFRRMKMSEVIMICSIVMTTRERSIAMKKFSKISLVCVLSVFLLYILVSIGFRTYVCDKTTIKFFNEEYTKFDCLEDFIPLGADNSWYEADIGYRNFLGLSFLKTDVDKNFIYYKDALGATVYKKNSYTIPKFPESNTVDKLMLHSEAEDKDIFIENREHIDNIIDLLSTLNTSENNQNDSSIIFYAVSNSCGGVFQLNGNGSIYLEDNKIRFDNKNDKALTDKLQDIIKTYINNID